MGRISKLHVAKHHLAEHIVDAGLVLQPCEIVVHGRGRSGDAVADVLKRREIGRVDVLEHELDARAAPDPVHRLAPVPVGAVGDAACLRIRIGDDDVTGDADLRQRRRAVAELFPLRAIAVADRARSRRRPERNDVDRVRRRPGDRFGVRRAVPERRVRPLHRLRLHDVVLVFVIRALEVHDVLAEGAHQHRESLVIHLGRVRRIDTETCVLEQRAAAPDADHQPPARQMVEHADLLVEPERMVERQHIDQRPEPQRLRARDRCGEENAWARRHAERRRMVLGKVIAGEALGLDQRDEVEPGFEEIAEDAAVRVEMVEDAELHARSFRPAGAGTRFMVGGPGGPSALLRRVR